MVDGSNLSGLCIAEVVASGGLEYSRSGFRWLLLVINVRPTFPQGLKHVLFVPVEDPCGSNPCQNGGSCSFDQDTISCTCLPHFGGDRCESGKFSQIR